MNHANIINSLSKNTGVFREMLKDISRDEHLWKPSDDKWCLLEIVCHLYDEEQYDFKARVKHVLEKTPGDAPGIDPVGWVKSKNYIGQNYGEVLEKFLNERKKSVEWLKTLKDPDWKHEYIHPNFGAMSAEFFLANWLAHDYLHFRQILNVKYKYLLYTAGVDLGYAGNW